MEEQIQSLVCSTVYELCEFEALAVFVPNMHSAKFSLTHQHHPIASTGTSTPIVLLMLQREDSLEIRCVETESFKNQGFGEQRDRKVQCRFRPECPAPLKVTS